MIDEYSTFHRGMHSGRNLRLLQADQAQKAINLSIKGGYWRTRPGARKVELQWDSFAANAQSIFENGRWQGASFYHRAGELHTTIDGNNFRIDIETGCVELANPPSGPGDPTVERVIYAEHDRYLLRQDGLTSPLIIDGGIVRNPNAGELPVGYYMASGAGYLVLGDVGRRCFRVSDFYGPADSYLQNDGTTGTPPNPITGLGYGPLTFNDSTAYYLNNGSFCPSNWAVGEMTGMAFISELDEETGSGNLMVGFENGWYSYDLNIPRPLWTQQPLGRQILQRVGNSSHYGITHLNGDLAFRHNDGIRTIAQSRNDYSRRHDKRSFSHELDGWMDYEVDWLLWANHQDVFDEQLFSTAMPEQQFIDDDEGGRYEAVHRGIFAYEFDVISQSQNEEHPPTYSGLWTYPQRRVLGIHASVIAGEERMYIWMKTPDGKNELWEQTVDEPFDDRNIRIRSRLDLGLRRFVNNGSPAKAHKKRLSGGEIYIDSIIGDLELDVSYRWDSAANYHDWTTLTFAASHQQECCDDYCEPVGYYPHDRPAIPLKSVEDPEECDPVTGRSANVGHELQVRLEALGHFEFVGLKMDADDKGSENRYDLDANCDSLEDAERTASRGCTANDYRYIEDEPIKDREEVCDGEGNSSEPENCGC